jgi:uncharacterized repeat protein (TIGR01451 family)
MNIFLPDCNTASRPYAAWAGAAALTLGALFGASNSYAAPPPANTLIGNQATAAYTDSTGVAQTASSNLVQTSIQQVGSFLLDSYGTATTNVQNTKTGAGGNTVYAPHVLTNSGNGPDSFNITVTDHTTGTGDFSSVQVFADANNDGLPDSTTALCTATVPLGLLAPNLCSITSIAVAGNGGTFPFVVAYTIPAGATTPTTPFASALVTARPTNPIATGSDIYLGGTNGLTPYAAADVDNVNLTTVAAFNATKSLTVPAVAGPTGAGWPAALTSGPRSGAACVATVADALAPAAGCVYTTYTINYKNTGGSAGAFYMNDVLPSGFTYVPGSAVWSSAGGVALTDAVGGDSAGIDYAADVTNPAANTVSALVANVGVNVSGTVSFIVMVDNTADVGTGTTTNTATYDPVTSTSLVPLDGAGDSNTNPAAFTVTATVSHVVGSATGTAVGSLDTVAGTPNGTAFDLNTAPTIVAGGSVKFTHTLFNTGNAADTINLSTLASDFPAGSVFTFYAADGATPLLDTNSDGKVDTGSIAAGGSTTFVLQVTIPGATPSAGITPFTVNVLGTSVADSTKIDAAQDIVADVVGALVDLTNSTTGNGIAGTSSALGVGGDVGQGPSPVPTTTLPTPAGTAVSFPLFVKNNDSGSLTFTLAASQTTSFPGSLPAGWTVTFGTAAGCAAPITTTTVAAGAQSAIFACVTPPVSAVAGTTNVYFKVTSTTTASTSVIVSDTKTDAVTVTAAATFGATLTPDNNGQVAPGGTVVYAHTLNATGVQACGTYTLNASQTQAPAGWTFALFIDVNGDGQIDAGDTPVVAGGPGATVNPALVSGTPQKILVRVFAPGGAVPGIQDTVTVTATFAANGSGNVCGPVSATDISTVVTGQIRVVKTQALDAACDGTADTAFSAALIANAKPGQCVIYKVIATNEGTAAITNLTINDALPNYTTLAGTQPIPIAPKTTQCEKSATVSGAPTYTSTGTTVKCGTATTVPPGGTLELIFAVKINQ